MVHLTFSSERADDADDRAALRRELMRVARLQIVELTVAGLLFFGVGFAFACQLGAGA
jgi:hypothetical protein